MVATVAEETLRSASMSTTAQRAQARVGRTLADRWRLERVLGVGGFAAVYAAEHIRSKRKAAIKILHTDIPLTRADLARFVLEMRAVNAIADHPGVVQIVDDGETAEGTPFFVMDLLDGETAEAYRTRAGGSVDVAVALWVADRTLDVLAAAHAKDILHRDVKPENLFLTAKKEVKLLDFGIARCRQLSTASRETQTGDAIGTLPFMAPEHAAGDWPNVDARTDLWSVGATLFTLLTGRYVHEETTFARMLAAATTRPARSIRQVMPGLPGEAAALVDRALAFDRTARWPDARAMQDAVRRASAAP